MKKIPMRSCIVTREKREKKDLLRVVRTPEGEVIFDKTSKQNGKGAYLKRDESVILKAKNSKILDRVLEKEVPESVYDELLKEVEHE